MAEPYRNPPTGPDVDRAKMRRMLFTAGGIALVIVLVAVIASVSSGGRTMSDGSNGSIDDPDLKELPGGVKYRIVKEGEGTPCPPGAKVKMHYTGWLTDGSVFDSSKERGTAPADFDLSTLIQGWQVGIPGMKPGEIRKLVIPADMGYGSQNKPKIPSGSTLIFEVELVSSSPGPRPRRSPAPTDLTKLVDGTSPAADDPDLKPIGTSGLMYRDIKVGDGPEAQPGSTVLMDYIGWRRSDGERFDTSWKPGDRPLESSLSGLIKGWQQGVPGMKVGGIRKLVIPPELGYPQGSGNLIPPGTTLVFEIELLGVK